MKGSAAPAHPCARGISASMHFTYGDGCEMQKRLLGTIPAMHVTFGRRCTAGADSNSYIHTRSLLPALTLTSYIRVVVLACVALDHCSRTRFYLLRPWSRNFLISDRQGWPLSHVLCFAAPARLTSTDGGNAKGLSGTILARCNGGNAKGL